MKILYMKMQTKLYTWH